MLPVALLLAAVQRSDAWGSAQSSDAWGKLRQHSAKHTGRERPAWHNNPLAITAADEVAANSPRAELVSCISDRKIWLLGNSVSRAMYFGAISELNNTDAPGRAAQKKLCGTGGASHGAKAGEECSGAGCSGCFSDQLSFAWQERIFDQPLADKLLTDTARIIKPRDIVIINVGLDEICDPQRVPAWLSTAVRHAPLLAALASTAISTGVNVLVRSNTPLVDRSAAPDSKYSPKPPCQPGNATPENMQLRVENAVLQASMEGQSVPWIDTNRVMAKLNGCVQVENHTELTPGWVDTAGWWDEACLTGHYEDHVHPDPEYAQRLAAAVLVPACRAAARRDATEKALSGA
jgi:hypothetical protein